MHTPSTPTPLTVGKLMGQTIGLYRTHGGIVLRTVAIFYVPVAALSFFFVEDNATNFLFTLLVWPVEAIVNLSLISHCVESLHGRPLALRTAIMRGLRRLPAHIGMTLATTAIYGGVTLVLAIPIWAGLLNADIPLVEIIYTFADLVSRGDVERINNVLDDVSWSGIGFCLSGLLIGIVLLYLSARWLLAEVALMAEGTGPLNSLRRSWNLSRDYVLRTAGYLILLSIVMGLFGALIGALVNFAVVALAPAVDQSWQSGSNYAVSNLLSIITTPFYVSAIVCTISICACEKRGMILERCSDDSGGGVGSCWGTWGDSPPTGADKSLSGL